MLAPATTLSVAVVELIVMLPLEPESAVPVVQPVPAPLVKGVVPFAV